MHVPTEDWSSGIFPCMACTVCSCVHYWATPLVWSSLQYHWSQLTWRFSLHWLGKTSALSPPQTQCYLKQVQKITLFNILKSGVERVRRISESCWRVRVCCACCTFRQWAAFHPRLRDICKEQSLEFIWNKCCVSKSIQTTTKECQRILSWQLYCLWTTNPIIVESHT
jgi:hypothetical protein